MSQKDLDKRPAREADRLRDEVLKRMLQTKPKPQKDLKPKPGLLKRGRPAKG